MATRTIRFHSKTGAHPDAIAAALAAEFGAVSTSVGSWSGDPRDGFSRRFTITAESGAASAWFADPQLSIREGSLPDTTSVHVDLEAEGADERLILARRQRLTTAFASLGYESTTQAGAGKGRRKKGR